MRLRDISVLLGLAFTEEQLAAITAPLEPGVIVAGAGSGKTTVMAARVVWLVATGQVGRDQVLGLTFTNKAAGELAHRVRSALARLPGDAPEGGAAARVDEGEPTVLTYHAYAGRLLAEHGLRIGVEPEARLLADARRYQLAARVIRAALGPFAALTSPIRMLVTDLLALDSELSEHLVSTKELRVQDAAVELELAAAPKQTNALREAATAIRKRRELAGLVDDYRAAKQRRAVVDFGDQMAHAAALAERRPEVGESERTKYRVVLLDEYQDTSVAQRRMLVGLFGPRAGAPADNQRSARESHPVTAVGDPCQAIYGWRGASVANLDEFPQHFPSPGGAPALTYVLTENRRSGGRILAAANSLSAPLRASHRQVVSLRPAPGAQAAGRIRCALLDTYADEMRFVGDEVAAALAAGVPAGEIAVLVRVSSDFAPLHAELAGRDLPVEVVGLGGLLELPEISDVVALLRVLDDPTSNAALVRLLTGPRWRIGARDLALLGQRASQLVAMAGAEPDPEDPDAILDEAVAGVDPAEVVSLADALESPGDLAYSAEARQRFAAVAREIRELRRHLGDPLLDLLHHIVSATGLDVELTASPHALAARRRDTLAAFLDVAAQFKDIEDDTSVSAFLAYLAAADEYERGLDNTAPTGADSVKLLTVHKAKGLEWDVVVVPNLSETVFPSSRGRTRWTANGGGKVLPYPLRGDGGSLPDVPEWTNAGLKAFVDACKEHDQREERRLGYVAVTRPRRLLVASGHWWGPIQKKRRGPSAFLTELAAMCAPGTDGEPGGSVGAVVTWADRPPDDAVNPQLHRSVDVDWPARLDPAALDRRRAAASAVLDALAGRGVAATLPTRELTAADAARVATWDRDIELLVAEAKAVRARQREVELPATLSASQLMRLAADPDGFARELARPMPRRPDPAARRGTRFHAWVETRFGQQPLIVEDELPGAADSGIETEADLALLREAFERSPYAARVPYAVEAAFELVLAGRVVRGRIDAVYETTDGFEVIDWKTSQAHSADAMQLAIYRVAWAEMHGVPVDRVHARFVYVRTGETVTPDRLPDRAALERLLAPDLALNRQAGVSV